MDNKKLDEIIYGKDTYSVDRILEEVRSKRTNQSPPIQGKRDYQALIDEILNGKQSDNNHADLYAQPQVKSLHEDNPSLSEHTPEWPPVLQENQTEPINVNRQNEKSAELPSKRDLIKNFRVAINYQEQDVDDALPPADFAKTVQINPVGQAAGSKILSGGVTSEFNKKRLEKVSKFVLLGDQEPDNDIDEEPAEERPAQPPIDDYCDYSDTQSVLRDIVSLRVRLVLRLLLILFVCACSVYLEFGSLLSLPVPSLLNKAAQPLTYLIGNSVLLLLGIIICAPAVFGGINSLFTFRADGDNLIGLAAIGVVVQNIVMMTKPAEIVSNSSVHLYTTIALLAMMFNTIGKLLIVCRVRINFKFISSSCQKYAAVPVQSQPLSDTAIKGLLTSEPYITGSRKTGFLCNFLDYSYREDSSDNVSRILAPIAFAGGLAVGVISYFMNKDIYAAVTAFCATLIICSPLSTMLAVNLPLFRGIKKLNRIGCMVSGFAACDELYDTNAVIIKSSDLFPKGCIQLHAIKTFAAGRIDEAILDAASVVLNTDSTLGEVFLSVIAGRRELLKEVDTITYEEGMGLSAWVDSKRVLIGNRELIRNHGIAVPSKDYEARYMSEGMDIVYLATSGELTAAFLISYNPTSQICSAIRRLEATGVGILLCTTDSNINSEKMAELFDISEESVKIVPTSIQGEVETSLKESVQENAAVASVGTLSAFIQAVLGAIGLKNAATVAVALQTAGVVLGYALIAFFSFFSGLTQISTLAVLIYQLFWLLAVLIIPALRKI